MIDRERDTEPAPSDPQGQLAHDLAEVRLAMANLYVLLEKVGTSVARIELCELTVEHRQNVQREKVVAGGRWLADLERRMRVVEGKSTAAE